MPLLPFFDPSLTAADAHSPITPGRVYRDPSNSPPLQDASVAFLSACTAKERLEKPDGSGFLWTSDLNDELPIKMNPTDPIGYRAPITVCQAFRAAVERFGPKPALLWKGSPRRRLLSLCSTAASPSFTRAVSQISQVSSAWTPSEPKADRMRSAELSEEDMIDGVSPINFENSLSPSSCLLSSPLQSGDDASSSYVTNVVLPQQADAYVAGEERFPSTRIRQHKRHVSFARRVCDTRTDEPNSIPLVKSKSSGNLRTYEDSPPPPPSPRHSAAPLSSSKDGTLTDTWQQLTWDSYFTDCCAAAKSLIALGVQERDRVCIMGFNAPEWCIACLSTIFCNAVSVSIYATSTKEATAYIVDHTQAKIAIVDSQRTADKFLHVKETSPSLALIIIYAEEPTSDQMNEGVLSWEEFLYLGNKVPQSVVDDRMSNARPGQCCELVYTSGTTGHPKGAMMSHDNLCWTAGLLAEIMSFGSDDAIVSYLPLSHIAPQMLDLYQPLFSGMSVHFASPDALRGSLMMFVLEVRPTVFFAVPRVWEKIESKLKEIESKMTGMKLKIFQWAKSIGQEASLNLLAGQDPGLSYSAAKSLVYNKIKKALGLDRCVAFLTGAAPCPLMTQDYFLSLGIPITDVYGMTECSGPATCSKASVPWWRYRTCGRPCPSTDISVSEPTEDGQGEICFRGRHVFMGYYKNPEATKEAIDINGFLHSGDLGIVDEEGFLRITGRKKELIVTAGGENIAPVPIEERIKEHLPIVANCQLIGDRQKFVSVLLCLKTELDQDMQPTNKLDPIVIEMLQEHGSASTLVEEAQNDPILRELISAAMKDINSCAPSRAAMINDWRILLTDFTVSGGELTPTLKVKRSVVAGKYKEYIEEIYRESETQRGNRKSTAFRMAAPVW